MTQASPRGGELVRTRGLTRLFGDRTAVTDLTLGVAAGEVVALLGPNGAGKTTTLRMLAGLIAPSRGSVDVRGTVGLLTESPGLWDRLSLRLNLLTYARLHELPEPHARTDAALRAVGLQERAGDRAGELSKGLKQRAAIARTLIHNPQVVLLDEPTASLDPASAREVRDLVLDLRRDGRAIIVSTHNLAEAEALADRVAVLKTSLLALDTPAALRSRLGGARVEVEVDGPAARWQSTVAAAGALTAEAHGSRLTLTLSHVDAVPDLVARLVAGGARIVRVSPDRRSLEDVYLDLVGHGGETA